MWCSLKNSLPGVGSSCRLPPEMILLIIYVSDSGKYKYYDILILSQKIIVYYSMKDALIYCNMHKKTLFIFQNDVWSCIIQYNIHQTNISDSFFNKSRSEQKLFYTIILKPPLNEISIKLFNRISILLSSRTTFLGCSRLEQSAAIILYYTFKGNCILASHILSKWISFVNTTVKLFDKQVLQR